MLGKKIKSYHTVVGSTRGFVTICGVTAAVLSRGGAGVAGHSPSKRIISFWLTLPRHLKKLKRHSLSKVPTVVQTFWPASGQKTLQPSWVVATRRRVVGCTVVAVVVVVVRAVDGVRFWGTV